MADNFSFESGKKFNLKDFSFRYEFQNSNYRNEKINKLIKFFDKDKDGMLSSNRIGFDKKSDASSLFKLIKKYIKDDGVFSDAEIDAFLKSHEEIADVSIKDFKEFISGVSNKEKEQRYTEQGVTTVPVQWREEYENYKWKSVETIEKEIPTRTEIYKNNSVEQKDTYLVMEERFCEKKLSSVITNFNNNGEISSTIEEKYQYDILSDSRYQRFGSNGYVEGLNTKTITETNYENGVVSQVTEKKYKKYETNLVEEKTSNYVDGVLTSATRIQYVDGKTIVDEITYEDDKPVRIERCINGEYVSTSEISEGCLPGQATLENGEVVEINMPCTNIETKNADGTISNTLVSKIDENGGFANEDFLQKTTIKDDEVSVVEKYNFKSVDPENKSAEILGSSLIETIGYQDGTTKQITYNSDNIFDYEDGKTFCTLQILLKDGRAKTCVYDGEGNTYVVLQNGDCASRIEASFRGDLSKEEFWSRINQLNIENYDEHDYRYHEPHECINYMVGEDLLVPGVFDVDSDVIYSRGTAEEEIQKYNEWYYNEIYKQVVTTDIEGYTLNKDYKTVRELAEDLLRSKFNRTYLEPQEIHDYANEILTLNNGELSSEKLKKGSEILIPNFTSVDKETRNKLESLGISASKSENHMFFVHFAKLESKQQDEVIEFISTYCAENKLSGELESNTFEEMKIALLDEKGICLTDSGRYIENNASFYKEILTKEEKSLYDGKKITLEKFIEKIGLDYKEPDSEGEKLYNILRSFTQEYLSFIPFGLLMEEIEHYKSNNVEITTELVTDLVEQLTLFNCSIRIVDGKIDNETINQKKKEVLENPPKIVQKMIETVFTEMFKQSQKALANTDSAWYQDVCNWGAERLEAAFGVDTDNRDDVEDALDAEKKLIKLFSSNPAKAFKSLTGYDFTYENINKVLNGDFELDSLGSLQDYQENLQEYKAWAKAIVITLVSIVATAICPVGISTLGTTLNYGLNLVKTCSITGLASVGYDLATGKEDFNFFESFMEGATVNGIMCLGNTAGSLIMRYLPKIFKFLPNIPMESGTAFNEICFGNVYSASSAWTNAGLYVAESVLQNGAIAALSGRDIANFDEYKFCFGAGLAAIKFGKFVKTAKAAENVSDTASAVSNLNKTVGVDTKAYRYVKKGTIKVVDYVKSLCKNVSENAWVRIGTMPIAFLWTGTKYVVAKNVKNIGDTCGNTSELIDVIEVNDDPRSHCTQEICINGIDCVICKTLDEMLDYIAENFDGDIEIVEDPNFDFEATLLS